MTFQPDDVADVGTPAAAAAEAARFAAQIRAALPEDVAETCTNVSGYDWRWATTRGVWTLSVGSILNPRPVVTGPAGEWRLDGVALHHADLVLLLLGLAGALPRTGPRAAAYTKVPPPPLMYQTRPLDPLTEWVRPDGVVQRHEPPTDGAIEAEYERRRPAGDRREDVERPYVFVDGPWTGQERWLPKAIAPQNCMPNGDTGGTWAGADSWPGVVRYVPTLGSGDGVAVRMVWRLPTDLEIYAAVAEREERLSGKSFDV